MIKVVYFDFGGVLVNYDKVFTKVCADFDLNFDEFTSFYHNHFDNDLALGKIRTEEFWQKCVEEFDLKNADDYDLPRWWVYDYDIIPVYDLIYSLKNKVEIGIISNIGSGIWEAAFKYKMVPNVEYKKVYLSWKLGMLKPNKEIYELAQKESKVLPQEILFVDDKPENLVMPNELGWKTILFDQFKAEDGIEKIREMLK